MTRTGSRVILVAGCPSIVWTIATIGISSMMKIERFILPLVEPMLVRLSSDMIRLRPKLERRLFLYACHTRWYSDLMERACTSTQRARLVYRRRNAMLCLLVGHCTHCEKLLVCMTSPASIDGRMVLDKRVAAKPVVAAHTLSHLTRSLLVLCLNSLGQEILQLQGSFAGLERIFIQSRRCGPPPHIFEQCGSSVRVL